MFDSTNLVCQAQSSLLWLQAIKLKFLDRYIKKFARLSAEIISATCDFVSRDILRLCVYLFIKLWKFARKHKLLQEKTTIMLVYINPLDSRILFPRLRRFRSGWILTAGIPKVSLEGSSIALSTGIRGFSGCGGTSGAGCGITA